MNKKNWVIAIAALAIAIAVCLFAYFLNRPNTAKVETTNTIAKPGLISQQDCDNQLLRQENYFLKSKISERDSLIAVLREDCGGNKNQTKTSLTYTKPKTKKTVARTIVPKKEIREVVVVQEPDAAFLTEQTSVPKSQVVLESRERKFCIKFAEAMYWPYLAVQLGETFPEIVDNGIGGYDLYLRPEGTVGSNGKDYGITEDGVYWIKASRLTNWADRTPYFINKNGIFVQGKLSGGYWIAQ